jgi:hypothetical protein
MYLELKTNLNPLFKKKYKHYCRILSKVITQAKKMEFDNHIANSSNLIRTSWNLINKELGNNKKNHGIQSLNINGKGTTNQQTIANAFNNYFTTLPAMITRKIKANSCLARNPAINQNDTSQIDVSHTPYPSIKYHRTTTKEITNIIKSLKSSNSSGYDEIPTKLLKLCSPYISSPLNYICNRTLATGIFPDRLKYASIRPIFKKGKKKRM